MSSISDPSFRHSERDVREVRPAPLLPDELVHELRQPLSVIESLAYYLELTSSDKQVCLHVQRIQDMVKQANRILERTSA